MASALLASSCANTPGHNPAAARASCSPAANEIDAARQVFQFAYPLYEVWRTRQAMLQRPGARTNALLHRTALSRPGDRTITTPNVDTLYSTAWIDLAEGPVRLSIPAMGQRYHSVALMHPFSDVFALLRNEGPASREFLVAGPGWEGVADPDLTIVRAPTRDVWLVARTAVQGPDDLPAAQRLQAAYALTDESGDVRGAAEPLEPLPAHPDAAQLLAAASAILDRGPLPPDAVQRISCTGPAAAFGQPSVDPALIRVLDLSIDRFRRETSQAFERSGTLRNGWHYPMPHLARFGSDDSYRSAVAMGGLAALPLGEAVNPLTMHDADGAPLVGTSSYLLRIPASVPVDGFWSLTLYESDGAGRWFLYDNPVGRHAISSLTPDTNQANEGGIAVQISHDEPQGSVTWLPAPEGPFLLVFRAYRPQPALADGRYKLAPVQRINDPTSAMPTPVLKASSR